jgi:hypothetical protein
MELFPAIILIIVAAIAGYAIGIVDSRMTAAVLKKTEDAKAATANASEAGARETANLPGEHTVLKVTIDNALKWHLELDGTRLEDPDTISLEQRQRTVGVVVQMRPWLDGKPAPSVVTAPTAPAALAPSLPPIKALSPVPAASTVKPISANPLKVDAMRGFRSLLKNDIKDPEKQKGTSLVALIDEVLQAKLLTSPTINKMVRLEDGPLGEVIVIVGSQRYNGVNAVPDPEIREIIQEAITDWGKK